MSPLQHGGQAPPCPGRVPVIDASPVTPWPGARLTRLDARGADLGTQLEADEDGVVDVTVSTPRLVRVTADGFVPQVVAIGRPDDGVAGGPPLDRPQVVTVSPASEAAVSRAGRRTGDDGRRPLSVRSSPAGRCSRRPATRQPLRGPVRGRAPARRRRPQRSPGSGRPAGQRPQHLDSGHDLARLGGRRGRSVPLPASTATAGALADAGIDVVSLANSHLAGAGSDGLGQTLGALDEVGIAHFGAAADRGRGLGAGVRRARGRTVALLGCAMSAPPDPIGATIRGPRPGPRALLGRSGCVRRSAAAAALADAWSWCSMPEPPAPASRSTTPTRSSGPAPVAEVAAAAGATVVDSRRTSLRRSRPRRRALASRAPATW